MKIAMIGHKRIPSREGGIEIVVGELATGLAARGHSVTVYNRGGEHVSGARHGGERLRQYMGVRIKTVPTPKNKAMNAMVYSLLATLAALTGGYDIMHYHAEGPSAMLFIPKLFGKKTVTTVHGLDWQRSKWGGFAVKYLLFGERMIAKYAGRIIVLSGNVRDYFKEKYGRDADFIPNAVSAPTHRDAEIIAGKYGLVKDGYILFLARLVPEKGLHYLLDAFKTIKTDKKLVVAGGVSHSDSYAGEIAAKAATDSRVIMTGFVQGDELDELYSNCFLYVLPSDVEGMPLTLLEAMSFGCRCLTSDIPENASVTGVYGRSFKAGSVSGLAEAMDGILSGETVYPAPNEIAEYITGKYSWDDIVDKTLALYTDLCS